MQIFVRKTTPLITESTVYCVSAQCTACSPFTIRRSFTRSVWRSTCPVMPVISYSHPLLHTFLMPFFSVMIRFTHMTALVKLWPTHSASVEAHFSEFMKHVMVKHWFLVHNGVVCIRVYLPTSLMLHRRTFAMSSVIASTHLSPLTKSKNEVRCAIITVSHYRLQAIPLHRCPLTNVFRFSVCLFIVYNVYNMFRVHQRNSISVVINNNKSIKTDARQRKRFV